MGDNRAPNRAGTKHPLSPGPSAGEPPAKCRCGEGLEVPPNVVPDRSDIRRSELRAIRHSVRGAFWRTNLAFCIEARTPESLAGPSGGRILR